MQPPQFIVDYTEKWGKVIRSPTSPTAKFFLDAGATNLN